jgi:hypothetical protein
MNRLGKPVAVVLLVIATAVLAVGCSEDGAPDGSLVTTTASSGESPGGEAPEAPATTEAPTTTEAATTTKAPDTTQPASSGDSSSTSDDSSNNAIWIAVVAVVVLVAVGAWMIGRGRSTETTTEATTGAAQPPPPPAPPAGEDNDDTQTGA